MYGVGALVGTTLEAVAGLGTSFGGMLDWWVHNSLAGTKGGI